LHALAQDLDLRLVNKRVFESLVKAGAFDSLTDSDAALRGMPTLVRRARLFAAIDAACDHGARVQRDQNDGQAQLFGGFEDGDGAMAVPFTLPDAPPWTEAEQLAFEKETLGLYWSGHPVDRYAGELKEYGARTTVELADQQPAAPQDAWGPGGRKPIEPDTSIGGIVAALRQLKTRKGDRMAVFTLEDALGQR
jgi:DNA polymerase-3 subunit alpha